MSQKRKPHKQSPVIQPTPTSLCPEGDPQITQALLEQQAVAEPAKPNRMPLFWRIFGGAAVAAVAIVCVSVYQQTQAQINHQRRELSTLNNDLRRDLAQLGSNYAEMIKKEDHSNRTRSIWDSLKELRTDRTELTATKERCALLLEMYKSGDEERRALLAEVRKLRETKKAEDERDSLAREIRTLRERIAQLEGNPKTRTSRDTPAEEQEIP